MFTPADEKLRDIIEEASDEMISMIDMELDEGSWVNRIHTRCNQLGLELSDAVKMIQVAEEIICLNLLKSTIDRIKTEEQNQPPDRVFIQGAGWVERWKGSDE
jgi:hypothetical protein